MEKNILKNLKEILRFFDMQYLEYGEKWNKEEGRTFFFS